MVLDIKEALQGISSDSTRDVNSVQVFSPNSWFAVRLEIVCDESQDKGWLPHSCVAQQHHLRFRVVTKKCYLKSETRTFTSLGLGSPIVICFGQYWFPFYWIWLWQLLNIDAQTCSPFDGGHHTTGHHQRALLQLPLSLWFARALGSNFSLYRECAVSGVCAMQHTTERRESAAAAIRGKKLETKYKFSARLLISG